MFWGTDISPEKEEEKIKEVAELIHSYEMETIAIFLLQTSRPMVFVGGQLGRAFTSPLFLILGDKLVDKGDEFFTVFEKRKNIDRLIELLKEMEEDNINKRKEADVKKNESKNGNEKKGWRRYLPF